MNKILLFLGIFSFLSNTYAERRFALITSLYNERHTQRMNEYKKCIEKNLKHPLIDVIHVVYDTNNDDKDIEKNELHNFLVSKNIPITYCTGRPTYQFCFQIAQESYTDYTIIVSNADIYFNETLKHLRDYDLTGKFLALTRWDERSDNKLVPYRRIGRRDTIDSQDAWIFELPLPEFEKTDIHMGVPRCDNEIAYQAKKTGLQVINPCKTIQCIHVHRSQVRHYGRRRHWRRKRRGQKNVLEKKPKNDNQILLVRWTTL